MPGNLIHGIVRSMGAWRNLGLLSFFLTSYYFFDRASIMQRIGIDRYIPYILICHVYLWIIIHNKWLVDKYLLSKKHIKYGIGVALGIYIISLQQYLIIDYVHTLLNKPKQSIIGFIAAITFYTIAGTMIYFARLFVMERNNYYEASAMRRDAELTQLKAQLNPHFLFNSLNNIYSYNLENSKHGNDLILKLSQLMRFILESSSKNTIKLREEISFIDNYIAFEKERLGYRCEIQYSKSIESPEIEVPPLLLFPFIENAVKHGSDTIQKTFIDIILQSSKHNLQLIVKNQFVSHNLPSTKTGLLNIRRRLELLFPNRHSLTITNDGTFYSINLNLDFYEN